MLLRDPFLCVYVKRDARKPEETGPNILLGHAPSGHVIPLSCFLSETQLNNSHTVSSR